MALDRISLRLEPLTLREGVTHDYTDWEISTNRFFTTTVLQSLNDAEHKYLKTFYATLETGVKHYCRSRAMLSTGYSKWSPIKTFTPTHNDGEAIGLTIPIEVGTPKVTTSSFRESHSLSDFTIHVDKPPIMGGSVEYTSTTYVIVDVYGDTVFVNRKDEVNQDSLVVSTLLLKPDSIYRIHVYRHTSSDVVSGVGTCTIKTIKDI